MADPLGTLCRIEAWSQKAGKWVPNHGGIALLDPERYVAQAAKRGSILRAIELDDRLQPTKIWHQEGWELLE